MEIEDKIAGVLEDIAADPENKTWDTSAWTQEVLARLADLGKRQHYLAYATGDPPPADGGEWLYDS